MVIIGGGYTAMDSSRTALRLGAKTSTIVYRRGPDEMVVDEEEQHETRFEGVRFEYFSSPVEVLADENGKVTGMKFERTELDGTGNARGTGEFVDYPVQAVYRAIGYFGSALPEIEFDHKKGVVPNDGGRVLDAAGTHVPGIYATGWIKRGPVGLIGHTKGDALETVTYLLEDRENLPVAAVPEADAVVELLDARGVKFTSWEGWLALDAHELALGAAATEAGGSHGVEVKRERIKVVPREDMIRISRD